ncbi:MAG: major capsid protein [Microvirus sp.]|nr:MAG: major capsid protein [Microvirus sp.]
MEKTLGGDRLGSGNKVKIELHNYERSTHDIGYVFRSTMSAGTLVPFMKEIALPGDSFEIDLDCNIMTHPTVGPLFGSYKVQLDVFQCPIRLYIGALHNNKLGIGMKMSTVKLPVVKLKAHSTQGVTITDYDNYQVNPSSILAYLGIRGAGSNNSDEPVISRTFNGIPFLAYWDIYKNYYANKQEEIGAVIHTGSPNASTEIDTLTQDGSLITQIPTYGTGAIIGTDTVWTITRGNGQPQQLLDQVYLFVGYTLATSVLVQLSILGQQVSQTATTQDVAFINGLYLGQRVYGWQYSSAGTVPTTEIDIRTFPLENIDYMRETILYEASNPAQFIINEQNLIPYKWPFEEDSTGTNRSLTCTQEGLGLKAYQSDILNNWLSTEWIDGVDGISEITAVDTQAGSFTMDTLNLAKKVYAMLNRIAVSGGSYNDWLDAVWTQNRYTEAESPIYHGGLIKELVFQEVISNSQSAEQPLGTLAGRGQMAKKHKGGRVSIKVDEPSYIIGIVSLTPRLDYSQGNDFDVNLETMDDLHKPALDQIGFQELITERMAWWSTNWDMGLQKWVTTSAGKQPAWLEYMTNVNKVRGNFAVESNEMFMILNRNYMPKTVGEFTSIEDLTTYIDPRIYNHIFAETSLDSQNFWTQISVDMSVRRKISARVMPNL